jgi:purine nucleosidase
VPALIVDTDGASDDAAALLMAARSPDLVAVTVTGGVVALAQAVANVLVTLAVAGRDDVPVYAGAARSLMGEPFPGAEDVHGPGGLGGHHFEPPARTAEAAPAADALDRLSAAGPTLLVTLGPMTNLAVALARGAGVAGRDLRVVAMAGSQDAVGNLTAVGEYNVVCDPEAAAAVMASGLDVTLVGWDVSRRDALIGDVELARLRQLGSPRAAFLRWVNEALDRFCRVEQGLAGYDLPDAAAVAVALYPSIVRRAERLPVTVETSGRWTRGMTVVDHRGVEPATATVVWSIDHDALVYRPPEALTD